MLDRNESAIRSFARRTGLSALAVAIAIVQGWTSWAMAQAPAENRWKEIRLSEPRGASAQAMKMLRDGQVTDSKAFDAYWGYFVSQLTWHENENNFAAVRTDIRRYLQRSSGAAHDRLAKGIVLPFCAKLAKSKDFSPQARVNAVLMIGELCDVEMDTRGAGARNLPEARTVLLELLDPQLPVNDTNDALRCTAMEGLLRHIERGGITDDKERQKIETVMQDFLKAQEAPAGRDAAVHKWMQAKASGVLAGVGGRAVARGG